jgi:hypothetical protein
MFQVGQEVTQAPDNSSDLLPASLVRKVLDRLR